MQQSAILVVLGVVLATALVLVVEAIFVISTGWAFGNSILGGRVKARTVVFLLFMLPTTALAMYRFASRPTTYWIAFAICVAVFATLACWFSIEFTWSQP
jgi:hydrogenase/urease accessory protein HupE